MPLVIPPKDTPFVDTKTGKITKPWYQYLHEGNLIANGLQFGWTELVAATTFSAVANVDIVLTSYTAYRAIKVYVLGVSGSVAQDMTLKVSTNGGSTYDAGASDYRWQYLAQVAGIGDVSDNSSADNAINIGFHGGAAGEVGNYEVTIYGQTSTSLASQCFFSFASRGTGAQAGGMGSGERNALQDTDAIRFLPDTGTISGTYSVYGLV